MKKYKVKVNGTYYEIEIELMSDSECNNGMIQQSNQSTASVAVGEQVSSPMPGTINSVNVKVGDRVKKGQVLMILEAMKLENEIMASQDGTISLISVSKGAIVETGTLLCVIQ